MTTAVEFVDRDRAYAEAARFVALTTGAEKANVEAWFALQTVADLVGPASNVGIRGIHWDVNKNPGKAYYHLSGACVEGRLHESVKAPCTLDEARDSGHLGKAIAVLERRVGELGGLSDRSSRKRPDGTGHALIDAVSSSAAGKEWLADFSGYKSASEALLVMVRVADAYGRDGVHPFASLNAHSQFIPFEERVQLVRDHPGVVAARAKAASLKGLAVRSERRVNPRLVRKLQKSSGASAKACRAILDALANGECSERQLMRAVKQAASMGATPEPSRPHRQQLVAA